jgi:hypothetical protein
METLLNHFDRALPAAPDASLARQGALERIASALEQLVGLLDPIVRLADRLAPPANAIVGTPDIARALGCTNTWVAELAREGQIPESCVVPGTGRGKPWRFYRERIDAWIKSR